MFLFPIILLSNILAAQDCDFNFEHGTVIYYPKMLEQTEEQKVVTLTKFKKLKACLQLTTDPAEQYWYASSIANNAYTLSDLESTKKYSLMAYELDAVSFCKGYIKMHVSAQEDDFPFKDHYLDVLDTEELVELRKKCQEEHLAEAVAKVERRKEEKQKELESDKLNKVYLEALKEIGINDQKERKQKEINWTIQNELDASNRIKLDELYDRYGFPSKSMVTNEGVTEAFMVLHHSSDCTWNEKWTMRFLKHYQENKLENLFSFYFFRNFNPKDGNCKDNIKFLEKIKEILNPTQKDALLNFKRWEN